jgi:hypothetical protein
MQRVTQFSFRVSNTERQVIARLAQYLKRSQSDAVRFLLIEAEQQLFQADSGTLKVLPLTESCQDQRTRSARGSRLPRKHLYRESKVT